MHICYNRQRARSGRAWYTNAALHPMPPESHGCGAAQRMATNRADVTALRWLPTLPTCTKSMQPAARACNVQQEHATCSKSMQRAARACNVQQMGATCNKWAQPCNMRITKGAPPPAAAQEHYQKREVAMHAKAIARQTELHDRVQQARSRCRACAGPSRLVPGREVRLPSDGVDAVERGGGGRRADDRTPRGESEAAGEAVCGGPTAVAPPAARGAALQQTKQKRSAALQRCNEVPLQQTKKERSAALQRCNKVPLQQTKKERSAALQRCNEVPLQRLSSHAY
jgi:hypothetical protein